MLSLADLCILNNGDPISKCTLVGVNLAPWCGESRSCEQQYPLQLCICFVCNFLMDAR